MFILSFSDTLSALCVHVLKSNEFYWLKTEYQFRLLYFIFIALDSRMCLCVFDLHRSTVNTANGGILSWANLLPIWKRISIQLIWIQLCGSGLYNSSSSHSASEADPHAARLLSDKHCKILNYITSFFSFVSSFSRHLIQSAVAYGIWQFLFFFLYLPNIMCRCHLFLYNVINTEVV